MIKVYVIHKSILKTVAILKYVMRFNIPSKMNLCLTKFIVYVLENVLKSVSNRNYVYFKISDRALIPLNFLHRISMYNFFLAFLCIFFLGIDLVTYQILQTSDFALFSLNSIKKKNLTN